MNIILAIILLVILPYVGLWKLFEKAGRPGWEGVIPLYNIYGMIKLSGRPAWWFVLVLMGIDHRRNVVTQIENSLERGNFALVVR